MIRVFDRNDPLDLPWPEAKRVAIKPNLTYPRHKPGVTTTPEVLERVVVELRKRGNEVWVVESDGGYGAWQCEQAMEGHGIPEMVARHGARFCNLTKSEWVHLDVRRGFRRIKLPFSKFLRDEIDVFITMPVPKVHCMTGVTLAMKNQWGVVPDALRMNFHYMIDPSLLAVNQSLPSPMVIADGTWFLDENGPLDGKPLRKDLIIQADTLGEFDRYMCALMSVDPASIAHLKHAMKHGFVPRSLDEIEHDPARLAELKYEAVLKRTPRNWLVLTFFHSKYLTRLIYTSWFGRALHRVFYAIVGQPTMS